VIVHMLVTRHTQLLAQFPSYSFFSFEHALPSSPALTTPAWSRHAKYASLVSQHRCRFSRLGSVESSFLLENHPMFDDSNEEAESGPSSTSCGKTGRSEFPHDSVFSRTSDRRTTLPSTARCCLLLCIRRLSSLFRNLGFGLQLPSSLEIIPLQSSPALRKVTLNDTRVATPQFQQLTHLDIKCPATADAILSWCSDAEEIVISRLGKLSPFQHHEKSPTVISSYTKNPVEDFVGTTLFSLAASSFSKDRTAIPEA